MTPWKFILPLFLLLPFLSSGQDPRLAQQYYQSGEFEKASVLYQKLYGTNAKNDFYFNRYIDCMIALEQYEECDKIIRKEIKKKPKKIQLYVTYGNLFERQYREAEAQEQYERAIKKLPADRFSIIKLANAFTNLTKYELAIATFEQGATLLKDKRVFSYNLGDLYRRKGDVPKMIENYLNSLADNPNRLKSMQTLFQRNLSEDGYLELQAQLYDRIQEDTEALYYGELLSWLFIQRKDYPAAFRQVKAIDRRQKENGARIYQLAGIAANDKDYGSAIMAYEYIIEEKGELSSFYIEAKRELLRCKRSQIVEGYRYSMADLTQLEKEYESFLDEFGRNKTTASIVAELADLEAFYLNNQNKAIQLLEELIAYPGLRPKLRAEAKLSLADFYLMKGESWEPTLLDSQVDKAFAEERLGHEARLRNAKLSYYAGDFQWAQAQFDVLKASTSKLIANDALDLSIFILDNLGLDTTATPLHLYAEADLLVFQNRFSEAFLKLDTLLQQFPEHSLDDDVLYTKAGIYLKKREYTQAVDMLQSIVDDYPDGIRADNALFLLADLNENQLNDVETAKQLYEKLFIEYSGSTFAVEARKRFRSLRGDEVQ